MDVCYYCGKTAKLVCDYMGVIPACGRAVCLEHAVPEFEGGNIEQFTLCKDHACFQVPAKPKTAGLIDQ